MEMVENCVCSPGIDDVGSELPSSKLGTKDYWDKTFSRELENYKATKDVGEVWFGDGSVKRVVEWMERSDLVSRNDTILDIGCGNGMTLVKLAKKGYTSLTGVDYSSNAVELARSIAEDSCLSITYEVGDVLGVGADSQKLECEATSCVARPTGLDERQRTTPESLTRCYDVCLDKGTYDAVSLNPDNAQHQRTKYLCSLRRLLKTGGLFIITSCNWTREELLQQFGSDFEMLKEIPTAQFQFGGVTGNKETVLVLRRTDRCREKKYLT